MALNKAKVLKSAEKFVIQGKISHAISEYQKLIKEDPTDLPLVNTLGDLYVRIGNLPEAIKCFTRLAESYDNGGFVVRAIAMYKKVSKIDPSQIQALHRLADLYLRQGLVSDARTHYLQVADNLLKRNENENATSIFQKIIQVDPENPILETRLADAYLKLGKKGEAIESLNAAAQKYRKKGSLDEAENILKKTLELDESNMELMLSYAGILSDSGKTDEALNQLGRIQFHDFKPEVHEAIFQINLKAGRLSEAENTAVHLLELDNSYFRRNLSLAEAYIQVKELDKAFAQIKRVVPIAVEKGDGQAIEEQFKSILQQDPEHIPSLLELIKFYEQSSTRHNVPSLLEKLGNIYARRNQLDDAVSTFKELIRLEPNEASHRETLNQLRQRLGLEEEDIELPQLVPDMSELADKFVSEPTITTIATESGVGAEEPKCETKFDDGALEQVKGFIVEGDLFAGYGLYQKAIDQYSKVLDVIPSHVEIHEKIRDMYAKSGEPQKAAQQCLLLANIYTVSGDNDNADRNFSLACQYDPDLRQAPAPKDRTTGAVYNTSQVASQPGSPSELTAVDAGRLQELLQEIDFYFDQGFLEEAKNCIDSYLKMASSDSEIVKRLDRYDSLLKDQSERSKETEVVGIATESDVKAAETVVEAGPAEGFETTAIPLGPSDTIEASVAGNSGFETPSLSANSRSGETMPAATAPSESFDEIMIDLDHELASSSLERAMGPTLTPESPNHGLKAKSSLKVSGSGLEDVFAEFKAGLEEDEGEVPDYETHYNLGIAFKEMGLTEEAIAEFQRALKAQSADGIGEEFVRCCNMLGLCFVEKGLPQVAIKWFSKGLASPGRDEETYQALRYDLGCAHEKSGNVKAALETFLDVYGVNINYRDVAEKIENLKKSF